MSLEKRKETKEEEKKRILEESTFRRDSFAPLEQISELKKEKSESKVIVKEKIITDELTQLEQEVLEIANGRQIIYISDFRLVAEQEAIYADMIQQEIWGVLMGAEFMLLKFRPPYSDYTTTEDQKNLYVNYDISLIKSKVINKDIFCPKHAVLYLKGKIYFQNYPKLKSAETRLFVKKIKYKKSASQFSKEDGDKYLIKYYDYDKYEKQMVYFNTHIRREQVVWAKSDDMKNHLLGYDDSYDCVSEYYIAFRYLKLFRALKENYHDEIIRLLYFINVDLNKRVKDNNIICVAFTATEGLNFRLSSDRIIANELISMMQTLLNSYSNQKELVKKSVILKPEEIKLYEESYRTDVNKTINDKIELMKKLLGESK